MRRSILLASALVTTLALSACGGTDDAGEAAEGNTEESAAEDTAADGGALTVWVDETRQAAVEAAAEDFEAETSA